MTRRIPLADLGSYARALRRSVLLRSGLAVGAVALLGLALLSALALRDRPAQILPPGSSGIIVLDVSSSITSDTYRQIEAALRTASTSDERYGLVLFSDTAYEALPPGTRAREVGRFRRYFEPLHESVTPAGYPPISIGSLAFPANPWRDTFSGGTRISTGLRLARAVASRDGLEQPSVLLVSDLADDGSDLPALGQAIAGFRRDGIDLRVLALSPSAQDKQLFERVLRHPGALREAAKPPRTLDEQSDEPALRAAAPVTLVIAAAVLLLLLAVNEWWSAPLTWGATRRPAGGRA
jgi:hypothetical protein